MFALMQKLSGFALMLALVANPASAADLAIWAAGAVKSAVADTLADFGKSAGVAVKAEYAAMGTLTQRLTEAPGGADVVILSAEAMDNAVKKGWVQPGSITEVGRVGVGVAVNENAASPDISTPEAFKETLLAAKSIIMVDPSTGTSGKHLAEVFAKLGIADAIKSKTTTLPGGFVVERVGTGEIELGLHQITEILPVKGIKLVGPLPPALQKVTIYQAASTAKSANLEGGEAFLVHIQQPAVRASFAKKGFMSP